MCVSCGVPLAIAESPQADAERREITRLIEQGKTKQEILDSLVATYGDTVLASPKDEGFGLAAYLVPIALVAGDARRARRRPPPLAPQPRRRRQHAQPPPAPP